MARAVVQTHVGWMYNQKRRLAVAEETQKCYAAMRDVML